MRLLPRSALHLPRLGLLLALALLATASCDLIGGNPSAADSGRLAEIDVQEAALRWAFANADTDLRPPAIHCIARVHGRPGLLDPSDTLLARFAADSVPVHAVSSCDGPWLGGEGRDLHPGVDLSRNYIFHPQSGQPGLLFILQPVEWDATGNAARVVIDFMQGGLWGTAWSCIAQHVKESEWRILECTKVAES